MGPSAGRRRPQPSGLARRSGDRWQGCQKAPRRIDAGAGAKCPGDGAQPATVTLARGVHYGEACAPVAHRADEGCNDVTTTERAADEQTINRWAPVRRRRGRSVSVACPSSSRRCCRRRCRRLHHAAGASTTRSRAAPRPFTPEVGGRRIVATDDAGPAPRASQPVRHIGPPGRGSELRLERIDTPAAAADPVQQARPCRWPFANQAACRG